MSGWGAALESRLDPGDEVLNFAVGGATTESFIAEHRWASLLEIAASGDVGVIQFGHNDQKQPDLLAAAGGYRDRLDSFVQDLRARSVVPVLCTSVERRSFDGTRIRPSHGAYPNTVRMLAAERAVPLIDLLSFTGWLYEHLGPEESKLLFTTQDDTHFAVAGAEVVAAFVARSLRSILGRDDALAPHGLAIADRSAA